MPINSMHLGSEILPRKDKGGWIQLKSAGVEWEAKTGGYEAPQGTSYFFAISQIPQQPSGECSNPIKQMEKLRPKDSM